VLASLAIYDILGREVVKLVNELLHPVNMKLDLTAQITQEEYIFIN